MPFELTLVTQPWMRNSKLSGSSKFYKASEPLDLFESKKLNQHHTNTVEVLTKGRFVVNQWLYLTFAVFSEVVATSALKSTEGFTKLWPSIFVLVGYSASFYFLSLTLESIPIGVVYAIWSGVGVAAITFVSIFFFDQKIDNAGLVGIALIVAGVMVLRLFSESSVDG